MKPNPTPTNGPKAKSFTERLRSRAWEDRQHTALRAEAAHRIEGLERENAELKQDAQRFEWALPILCALGPEGDQRALALAGAFLQGKDGREAIDAAMGK